MNNTINITKLTFDQLNSCFEDTTGHTVQEINPFCTTKMDIMELVQSLNEEYRKDFYANLEDYK